MASLFQHALSQSRIRSKRILNIAPEYTTVLLVSVYGMLSQLETCSNYPAYDARVYSSFNAILLTTSFAFGNGFWVIQIPDKSCCTRECIRFVLISFLQWIWRYSLIEIFVFVAAEHKNARCGAKLTCHILLKLFDANSDVYSSRHNYVSGSYFKTTPEHSLLIGSFHHVSFELLFYVLKLLMLIADSGKFLFY